MTRWSETASRTAASKTAARRIARAKLSPYDAAFRQHLINYGIFPPDYKYPGGAYVPRPPNWQELLDQIRKPRPSLDGLDPNALFDQIRGAASNNSELQANRELIPKLGSTNEEQESSSGGLPLGNYFPLTNGTLVASNPDLYHGVRPEQLKETVRKTLNNILVPSSRTNLPILPNFFLAVKAFSDNESIALNQACYDGAFGARAMQASESFSLGKYSSSGNARVISSTIGHGTLKLYACHSYESRNSERYYEYTMSLIRAYTLNESTETCLAGLKAYRNLVDWANTQRQEVIERLNRKNSTELLTKWEESLVEVFVNNKRMPKPNQTCRNQHSQDDQTSTSLGKRFRASKHVGSNKRKKVEEQIQQRYNLRGR